MLEKPQFNPRYSVIPLEPDRVFLLSERETVSLSDRFSYLVASLIDGERSSDEIIDAIQTQLLSLDEPSGDLSAFFQDAIDVSLKAQYALFQLERAGYLMEGGEGLSPTGLEFCYHLNLDPTVARERLRSTRVAVKAFDCLGKSEFTASLQALNVRVCDESDFERADFTVVLTEDYLNPQLEAFNRESLQTSTPWLLIKPSGTTIWIGPFFDAKTTACWQCLAVRLQENRPVAGYLQRTKSTLPSPKLPQLGLPSTLQTALGMAATEVFKGIVTGENSRFKNTLITWDALTLQTREHCVVKRPQCSHCGPQIAVRKPLPVVLGHRRKTFTEDGGHRCYSPGETLRKYQHLISPLTGVVRELTKLPGSDLMQTYVAKHHFATIFDDLDNLRQNLGGRSAGKGRTDLQARASGFGEAIERYSGVFQGDEIRERGSYLQLGERAIHPNACMNFSARQYETRTEWNTQCRSGFQKVPEPFDEEREIDWTPVWSLTEQAFKYLPTAYCYYGYPQTGAIDCWADSNGCAAGNTIEEAILQGFMELVERDSVALWWYNRLQKPRFDLESLDDPYIRQLESYHRKLGRELWVLDITSDLEIPTFAAMSRRCDCPVEDIVMGFGTHFDPKIALSRALTEVNQILPNVLSANADGTTQYPPYADPLAIAWWTGATVADRTYLKGDENAALKTLGDYSEVASDDLLEDVKLCQKIVEAKNMEMLVLDQTRPDIGFRVAKVIVPGLRHWWQRLGAGRLYEVPVQMSELSAPLTEERLNSFPMWM